jgi:hypothetical protein
MNSSRRRFLIRMANCLTVAPYSSLATTSQIPKYQVVYYPNGRPGLFCQANRNVPFIGGSERLWVGDIEPPMLGFWVNDPRVVMLPIWRSRSRPQDGLFISSNVRITFGLSRCIKLDAPEWHSLTSGFGRPVIRVTRSRFFQPANPVTLPVHRDKEWVGWTVPTDPTGKNAVYFPAGSQTVLRKFGQCLVYDGAGWGGMAFTFGDDMPRAGTPVVKGVKAF